MGMRHRGRLALVTAWTLGLAACNGGDDKSDAAEAPPIGETPTAVSDAPLPAEAPTASSVGIPASADAPAFAVIYPGGARAEAAADTANAQGVTYVVAATPDQVLDFYQAEADKAGLSPVMALRQGERGGFGAMSATTGESLDVWAESAEAGQSRVTLNWHHGGE